MSGCSRAEQRFHNCCNQRAMKRSGVFLKKTSPFADAHTACRFWNRSKTLRRKRGDRRFNSGQPLQTNATVRYLKLAWQRGHAPHS